MTKRMMQALGCVFALCLFLILPVASHAQAVYGSITGTVTDQTGAAIPNATVTVTDEEKGTASNAITTNGSGEFTVDHLIVDKYDLKIGATGFKDYEAKGIQVFVDTAAKVTAQLQIGANTQTVEVSADSIPVLKTDRADVATVFTQKDIQDLPTGGRNFTGLELLLPGAQLLGWSHAADENPQGSEQIQVDGQAFGGVAYELDGTDNQDPILGIIVINPSLDALNEAKITTQNYDASFGKAVSAVVVASTKSGTNSFHGSAYDYRNSTYNQATDPWSQFGSNRKIPPGLKNLFGGSVGGPILKDKLFFFGDYQGIRQKVATSATDTIPTDQLFQTCLGLANGAGGAGCDFSQYGGVDPTQPGAYGLNGAIYQNGNYQAPYAHNTVPTAQLAAPSIALLKDMYSYIGAHYGSCATTNNSAPYCQPTNNLVSNFSASGTGLFNANQYDVRVDGQVSATTHAFARFSRFTDALTGTQMFGSNVGGPGFGLSNYGGVSTGANDSVAAGMDFQLSPKWLYDFRLGYYRYNIIDNKNNSGVDYMSQLGIMGENLGGLTSGSGGFNLQGLPGGGIQPQYGSFLGVNRCNCPLEEREDQYQIVNNLTHILGNHQFKFGADLRYARNLRVPSDVDRTGINGFGIGPTSDNKDGTGGLSLATFVLGDVTSFGRYVSTSTNAKEFQKRTFFYAQDTWRITSNLTFNYGLRYELYFPEAVNAKSNGALLNLQTGFISVAGEGSVPSDLGWSPDKVAFAPRIGIAYQMNPKTVIRAGYGRSYDIGVFGSIFGHNVTQNLPVLANQEVGDNQLSDRNNVIAFNYGTATAPAAPGVTVPGNGLLPNPGYAVNSKARPDPLRLPLLDAWNAAIQRSLTPTLSLTVAYVGNKGTHTLGDGDSNNTNPNEAGIFLPAQFSIVPGLALHFDPTVPQPCPAGSTTCKPADVPVTGGVAGISANGGTAYNNYLQRFYGGTLPACQNSAYTQPTGPLGAGGNPTALGSGVCGWTQGISYYADALDTHFNALQVTIAKQLGHGLSFTSNYQWARAFDYNAGYATWNKQLGYGRDSAVREQQEVLFGVWQLPFGRGGYIDQNANKLVDYVIGHWEISGTTNWAGGLPFTLGSSFCGKSIPGDAPCYAYNTTGARIPISYHKINPHLAQYFVPTNQDGQLGFTTAPLDTVGNVGRNNYFGPMFINTDAAIQKNFPIHEAILAQFRMDVFNLFNHVNPGGPNSTVDAFTTTGQPSNTSSNGQITSENGNGGILPLARYLSFSLRVQF